MRLTRHVRDGGTVTLPLTLYGDDGTGTYAHRPAGTATLRYARSR